jgi:hypothetical protein
VALKVSSASEQQASTINDATEIVRRFRRSAR